MARLSATFITMFSEPMLPWLSSSIIGRAIKNQILQARVLSILDSVQDHHAVDDRPYGGGPGELMKIDVIAPLIQEALDQNPKIARCQKRVLLMDPAGAVFDQAAAERLSNYDELIFICGRYEGIDARVHHYVDEAISLGDYVLSSGDLAAMAIFDATARLIEGVLGNHLSIVDESHARHRLEASLYTRPAVFEGHSVPQIFQSGDHALIAKAKRQESLYKTLELRPDLIDKYPLNEEERAVLHKLAPNSTYPWMKK